MPSTNLPQVVSSQWSPPMVQWHRRWPKRLGGKYRRSHCQMQLPRLQPITGRRNKMHIRLMFTILRHHKAHGQESAPLWHACW